MVHLGAEAAADRQTKTRTMTFKTTTRGLLVAFLALGAAVEMNHAVPVTIPDFSFENTPIATTGGNTGAPNVGTNWSSAGGGGVYIQDLTNTLFTPSSSN